MMVRNEGHVIANALRSVKRFINYYVIADTGSDDNTKDVIREELKDIPGELIDVPFKNYGYNRTKVFEAAAHSGADYYLVLDADDVLTFKKIPHLTKDCYEVEITLGAFTYRQLRLFSSARRWSYVGAVHEVPLVKPGWTTGFTPDVSIQSFGTGATSKDPAKYLTHAKMLEDDIRENPECDVPRATFYLAQSYNTAGEFEKAIKNYKIRIAMGPGNNAAEIYYSYYQMGNIFFNQSQYGPAVSNYLLAVNEQPYRAEPLFQLCRLYRQLNKFTLGFMFGYMALPLKVPDGAIFPEPLLYNYLLWDELAICAYYVGKKKLCKQLNNKILAVHGLNPEFAARVKKNSEYV
jgi:glycosyltransferase involved in cell wall biosynthesis